MSNHKYIKSIHEASLTIEDIRTEVRPERFYDPTIEEDGNIIDLNAKDIGKDQKKSYGLKSILTVINGTAMQANMIDSMSIDVTDTYPTITMRIFPNHAEFINFALPKDGDIINIYYRSTLDEYKPLRMDFMVVNCVEEYGQSFVIYGVINIPNLFKDISYANNNTSIKTMIDISNQLGLGFATNVDKTDDKQSWVCANQPLDTFIEEVKLHAWANEKSFFDVFVDHTYTMNFIDVGDQMSSREKEKQVYPAKYKIRDLIQTNEFTVFDYDDTMFEYEYPLILHNWKNSVLSENNISAIRVLNQSSRISLEEGYRKILHFYDHNFDEKVELLNQLIVDEGATDDNIVLLGGVSDKDWKTNTRHLWRGINYSLPDHNTHPYYYLAEYHNEHNLKEIDKFTIEITLPQVNFNIHRYMTIPVVYYEYGDIARKLRAIGKKYNNVPIEEQPNMDTPYIVNNFLSGFYIVKGFYIDHMGPRLGNPSYIRQRVILTRTEWPKSIFVTDKDNAIVSNITK